MNLFDKHKDEGNVKMRWIGPSFVSVLDLGVLFSLDNSLDDEGLMQ